MFELPIIDDRIAIVAPGFRAKSVIVDATSAAEGQQDHDVLSDACAFVTTGGPSWADAHLASWADAYQRFGAKPNRTPCSAQALRKPEIVITTSSSHLSSSLPADRLQISSAKCRPIKKSRRPYVCPPTTN